MSVLYRLDKKGSSGWAVVSGYDLAPPEGDGWRLATFREWLWHSVTVKRWSLIELVAILALSSVVSVLVRSAA
jgi:hypothetical protein